MVFTTWKCLACAFTSPAEPVVNIHHVLNHPDTPLEVIEFICKHELLHFLIPPRAVGKKVRSHPPEFWLEEERIAPEGRLAWAWLWLNLGSCLKTRPKLERVEVTAGWRKLELSPRSEWSQDYLQRHVAAQGDWSLRALTGQ
ncbi:MAG: hypothetical protein KGK07_15045 [Chloroflexota bacterium]|nr:hypothetical protein [Chloroflexota bacterium]